MESWTTDRDEPAHERRPPERIRAHAPCQIIYFGSHACATASLA